ncbi:TPA: hypothetical protein VDW84_005393 [Pseudomonas aeruginosa]|uniref:hypothetical protein n=2 Tax=Pseudomonas aeruginosa TaxID=287 RepID=UPI00163CB030|nr:hypothetical protein [Pseudomonas aeruginosa]HEK2357659.1 hypothetical protein [Pseudomonas aeruginosa]HEQ0218643.1 hypothetical protein [Pseudomonas aeruginosa]
MRMAKFIFTRRSLQESINSLEEVLDLSQIKSLVDRINKPGERSLHTMWEIAVLDALSKCGKLSHEKEINNGKKPDIELVLDFEDDSSICIVGDITTISDNGLHSQNPIKYLRDEIRRLCGKFGLSSEKIALDVRGRTEGNARSEKVRLKIPGQNSLKDLINNDIATWLKSVKANASHPNRIEFNENDQEFSLSYNPSWTGGEFTSHASYTVALSINKNPIYNSLKKKLEQLKRAPPNSLRIIFACDGGCDLFRRNGFSQSSFSAADIAREFLRNNSSIDAVVLLTVFEERKFSSVEISYYLKYQIVLGESPRLTSTNKTRLEVLTKKMMSFMSSPVNSAYNAAVACLDSRYSFGMAGGYQLNGKNISISSKALHRLLSGEITLQNFFDMHGWSNEDAFGNPFARNLKNGFSIKNIEILEIKDKEDEWLEFKFGGPDASISPFRVNKK